MDKVRKYKNIDMRFHMPAHADIADEELYSNAKFDITELNFSDNLLQPEGVILELEKELARVYGSKRCLILTNGATCGNFIAINVLKSYGKILVCPNCHKSIYNAIKLFDADADFIDGGDYPNGLPMPVNAEDIDYRLNCGVKYGSVILTSPTYFGSAVSAELILKLKKRGLKVFADQSHGGHFVYSSLLPDSLSNSADIVVDSLHKTLPVYTGGALLHINNDSLITKAEFYHSILHSSSPNYVTMCSIDYTQDKFKREGETLYASLYERLMANKLDSFKIVKTDDFSRLVVDVAPYSAKVAANLLEKFGIYIEMSYKNFLILILSPLNADKLDRLFDSLNAVADIMKINENFNLTENTIIMKAAAKKVEITNEKYDLEFVPLEDCENRLSYAEIGIYPPGIPFIKAFDRISPEQKKCMLCNRNSLFGLVSGKICVIVER